MALQPAKIFTGRVTYADTGKPVPGAESRSLPAGRVKRGLRRPLPDRCRRSISREPLPGRSSLPSRPTPPAGQPYLAASKRVEWPKGAIEQSVDLALPRGVPIRGKVIEEGSTGSDRRRVGYLQSRNSGGRRCQ